MPEGVWCRLAQAARGPHTADTLRVGGSCDLAIFPVGVRGNSSTNSITSGTMKRAMFCLQCSSSSSSAHGCARPQRQVDLDVLLTEIARDPDGRGLGHRRMELEGLLDLELGDVLPTAADHLVHAAEEMQIAPASSRKPKSPE